PGMVSFEILLPDNVVRQKFNGGSLYVSFPQTGKTSDSGPSPGVTERAESDEADESSIATEIVGRILEMRKDMNLEDEQQVEVKISANEGLLVELESQKDRIVQETNSKCVEFVTKESIEGEDGYTIEWQVADETFMISLRRSQGIGSAA
ncbi:MAG: hypothetical protein V3V21_04260, partial [Thermoplasmata archaeon]